MGAEERLKNAGFKKIKNDGADDCCSYCNYCHYDKTEASCTLHGVRLGSVNDTFEYICAKCDCSTLDSLIVEADAAISANQKRKSQGSKKSGWLNKIFGN